MAPALNAGQLALARHCLAYNDATDYHLHKLSSIDIQDIVQCSAATLCRLRKSWKKTGDVERLCKAGGRPRKIEDRLEEALVQLFLDHVDITIDEALEWLIEEFKVSVSKITISRVLSLYQVTHKRLKFVAAQRNPQLRVDYRMRVHDMASEQLVFLDESDWRLSFKEER